MDSQTSPGPIQLGFIGGGKLAGSVIRGLVRARYCPAGAILVSEPNEAARRILEYEVGVSGTAEKAEVAEQAEAIFMSVKPGVVLPALGAMAAPLEPKLVISPA